MNRLREKDDLCVATNWRLAAAYALAGKPEVANDMISLSHIDQISEYKTPGPTYGSVFAPTWSPDGTKIAYTTFGSQLRVVTVDGTNDYPVPNVPSGYVENADWGIVNSKIRSNKKPSESLMGSMRD